MEDQATILELREALDALIRSLDDAGIEYAVCGALALAVHGHSRATKDIDILAHPSQLDAVKAVARTHGFTLEGLAMTFRDSGITMHRLSRIAGATLLTLDILLGDGPLAAVWESREQIQTSRGPLWVVSRPGLITMKLAAGRPQDLADLAALEGSA